jgi:hypothetical protein
MYLCNGLWLVGLLGSVFCQPLLLELLSLGILLLVVRAEKVNVVLLGSNSSRAGSSNRTVGVCALGLVAGERVELGSVRLDVSVPARRVGSRGCSTERLEDGHVSLRGGVAVEEQSSPWSATKGRKKWQREKEEEKDQMAW